LEPAPAPQAEAAASEADGAEAQELQQELSGDLWSSTGEPAAADDISDPLGITSGDHIESPGSVADSPAAWRRRDQALFAAALVLVAAAVSGIIYLLGQS
jgi:hypothetical protein